MSKQFIVKDLTYYSLKILLLQEGNFFVMLRITTAPSMI